MPLVTSKVLLQCLACAFNTPDKACFTVCVCVCVCVCVYVCVWCVWLKQPAGGGTSSNLQYLQLSKKSLYVAPPDVERSSEKLWQRARRNCVRKAALEDHCVFSLSFSFSPSVVLLLLKFSEPSLKLLHVRRRIDWWERAHRQPSHWAVKEACLPIQTCYTSVFFVFPQLTCNTWSSGGPSPSVKYSVTHPQQRETEFAL